MVAARRRTDGMMDDMDDLVQWLNGCYDRAEQRAKAATPGPWHEPGPDSVGEWNIYGDGWVIASTRHYPREDMQNYWPKLRKPATVVEHGNENAAHIAGLDPSWRLADIARKRKILALHDDQHDCGDRRSWECPYVGCATARLLAEEFSGEPGYREEWRP